MEAMELHKNIGYALGAIQAAKDAVGNYHPPQFEIGRSEGICQSILEESAKLYCNLQHTRVDDIDDLIAQGQITPNYRDKYNAYSKRRRGWFSAGIKQIVNWF
jgi:hypothetical protein